jgi:hypothetical protein
MSYVLESVFKHLAQTFMRLVTPSLVMVTFWMLGFHWRLVAFFEWLTLCPNWTPLPQMSHLAMFTPLFNNVYRWVYHTTTSRFAQIG